LFRDRDRFAPGLRFSNNFPSCMRREELLQTASNNIVIVRNYNPKGHQFCRSAPLPLVGSM
jgi:hypothetical protein